MAKNKSPIKVVTKTFEELCWPWSGNPYYTVMPFDKRFWSHTYYVDPFPGYMHDVKLVRSEAKECQKAFPLNAPLTITLLDRETTDRTNGQCDVRDLYDEKKTGTPQPWAADIVLWGKRIPPHPAMTRYLVNHEYGHAVAKAIHWSEFNNNESLLFKQYRSLRKKLPKPPHHYGGGTWGASIGEIFANDFRIIVMNSEVEFWPHAGVSRPEDSPKVVEFWKKHTKA